MRYHLNRTQIIGNIGKEPRYALSSQGQPRFVFDVCVSKPYKDNDEWKSQNTWFNNCIAWGDLATMLSRMQLAKGERVFVEGEMVNNDWISSQTNEPHHEMQLKVISVYKMAKAKTSGNAKAGDTAPQGQQKSKPQAEYQAAYEAQQQADMDDLPF